MSLISSTVSLKLLKPLLPVSFCGIRWRHQWGDVTSKEWYSFEGREEPLEGVPDRFKRLNHGLWIHARPGSHRRLYRRTPEESQRNRYHVAIQFAGHEHNIFRMASPFFRRPKYYAPENGQDKEPYEPYQRRWGMEKHGYVVVPKFLP